MSGTLNQQPARVPLVDPQTGVITREWYKFFEQLFVRSGGSIAPTNDDLARDLPEDAGIEETKADLYRLRDEANSQPPTGGFFTPVPAEDGRLQALEAELARLVKEVEALKQGVIL